MSGKHLKTFKGLAIVGGVIFAASALGAPQRAWSHLLVLSLYLITLGLGGAVLVALTYVCGGGWHVAFRRVPESMAKIIPIAGLLIIATLALNMQRYQWHPHQNHAAEHQSTHHSPQHHNSKHHAAPQANTHHKQPNHASQQDAGTFWFKQLWLSQPFWLIRSVSYILLWSLLAYWLTSRSKQQDHSGDAKATIGNVRLSAFLLAVVAVTFSLASVDWIMALDPMWFSTMWGVYNFSGMMLASLAVVVILGLALRKRGGPLEGKFNDEHLHDLGKLVLGFSCFWMYIWYSQYMLIWYSNIPEETFYFVRRLQGAWSPVVIVSLLLNWVIPFFILLPKPAKRSASTMAKIAGVLLVGRWVDLYLMILPSTTTGGPIFSFLEVGALCTLIGISGYLFTWSFPTDKPIPVKDPLLPESLHYHA